MEPYGLDAIVALNRLPYFKTGTSAYGRSSYDGSGGNYDSLPTADAIVLNVLGPGTVYRMWFTGFAHDATIDFYFDDESTPRHYTLHELFTGEVEAFKPPLVGIGSGGGYYCYVPLPFRHSLRVITKGAAEPGRSFFYNIGYHLYAPGTDVVSWTGHEDTTAARGLWELAKDGMDPFPGGQAMTGRLDAPPKSDTAIATLDGPAVITCLRLRAEEGVLDNLYLRIFWDDEPDAAVDAPMRMFFARGYYPEGEMSRSLVVGINVGGWHYTYFPMPFQARARIFIRNPTDRLVPVSFELRWLPFDDDVSHVGYFRTRYSRHFPLNPSSIHLLDAEGSGHLVGVVASVEGPDVQDQTTKGWELRCYHTNELCFLEGDEQIFVDGASSPAIQGTGMEDFFNAAWYFAGGPFNTPLAGCTLNRIEQGHGRTSAYRLFLQDAVPFRQHIRMCLERGPENDVPVLARTLAYYYFQPIVRLSDSSPSLRSPRVPPGATISAVSRSEDKLDLFVVDDAGAVVTAAWDPSRADWYMWPRVSSAVASPGSVVDAACRSKDKLDVFFTDTNGEVWTAAWESGRAGWQSSSISSRLRPGSGLLPEIEPPTPVSAIVRRDDRIDVFARDRFGHIHVAAWPEPHPVPGTEGAHWAGWWPTLLWSGALTPARGVSRSLDKLDLFATDGGGQIFTAAWEPSFSEWHVSKIEDRLAPGSFRPEVEPGATVTVVSRAVDHEDIFVIGKDGGLYTASWQPGFAHWSGWRRLEMKFRGEDVQAVSGKAANVVSRSRDGLTLDVFLTDRVGAIHTAAWNPKDGWSHRPVKDPETRPRVDGGSPVAVCSRRKDYLDIFVAAVDQRIWTAAWDPDYGPWRPWKPIGY